MKAIDGFARDEWRMSNQASYGVNWFFKDEDRLAGFISSSKQRKGPMSYVIR